MVNQNKLVVTRIFNAPRELVWKAWTDPEMDEAMVLAVKADTDLTAALMTWVYVGVLVTVALAVPVVVAVWRWVL